jgi:hypothetical protein
LRRSDLGHCRTLSHGSLSVCGVGYTLATRRVGCGSLLALTGLFHC